MFTKNAELLIPSQSGGHFSLGEHAVVNFIHLNNYETYCTRKIIAKRFEKSIHKSDIPLPKFRYFSVFHPSLVGTGNESMLHWRSDHY